MVCDGCPRHCRYRDFRVFSSRPFQEMYTRLWKETDDSEQWVQKSRGVVLGLLHEEKRELWEYYTEHCPLQGTDGELESFDDSDVPF